MTKHRMFAVAQVKAVEGDSPNGEFEVILSAPTLDRDGEVIDAKAFEPLPDHITFDIDHGMSVSSTVGSGQPFYDGDLLKVRGSYASTPLAQEVRTLVSEGHIRTTSVAFMDAKREVKDGVPHIVKAELLNGAFVAVPSNRDALVLAGKALGREREDRKSIAGSFEHRRDLIREAVRDANPEAWWVGIVATFDDSVVYEVDTMDGTSQFQASYSIDDADVVTLGTAEPVEVTEVVTPAKGVTPEKSTNTDPEKAAAAAAASPADVTVEKARAAVLRAEAELLLIT